jgi:hypothetical protein
MISAAWEAVPFRGNAAKNPQATMTVAKAKGFARQAIELINSLSDKTPWRLNLSYLKRLSSSII